MAMDTLIDSLSIPVSKDDEKAYKAEKALIAHLGPPAGDDIPWSFALQAQVDELRASRAHIIRTTDWGHSPHHGGGETAPRHALPVAETSPVPPLVNPAWSQARVSQYLAELAPDPQRSSPSRPSHPSPQELRERELQRKQKVREEARKQISYLDRRIAYWNTAVTSARTRERNQTLRNRMLHGLALLIRESIYESIREAAAPSAREDRFGNFRTFEFKEVDITVEDDEAEIKTVFRHRYFGMTRPSGYPVKYVLGKVHTDELIRETVLFVDWRLSRISTERSRRGKRSKLWERTQAFLCEELIAHVVETLLLGALKGALIGARLLVRLGRKGRRAAQSAQLADRVITDLPKKIARLARQRRQRRQLPEARVVQTRPKATAKPSPSSPPSAVPPAAKATARPPPGAPTKPSESLTAQANPRKTANPSTASRGTARIDTSTPSRPDKVDLATFSQAERQAIQAADVEATYRRYGAKLSADPNTIREIQRLHEEIKRAGTTFAKSRGASGEVAVLEQIWKIPKIKRIKAVPQGGKRTPDFEIAVEIADKNARTLIIDLEVVTTTLAKGGLRPTKQRPRGVYAPLSKKRLTPGPGMQSAFMKKFRQGLVTRSINRKFKRGQVRDGVIAVVVPSVKDLHAISPRLRQNITQRVKNSANVREVWGIYSTGAGRKIVRLDDAPGDLGIAIRP